MSDTGSEFDKEYDTLLTERVHVGSAVTSTTVMSRAFSSSLSTECGTGGQKWFGQTTTPQA